MTGRRGSPQFASRIYLVVIAVLLVAMTVSTALFLLSQNSRLEAQLDEQGVAMARSLSEAVWVAISVGGTEALYVAANGTSSSPDVAFVDVYDANEDPLVRIGAGHLRYPPNLGFDQAAENGLFRFSSRSSSDGEATISSFLVPARNRQTDTLVGYVCIGLSRNSLIDAWQSTLRTTLAITLTLLCVSALAAYWLARRTVAPLKQLAEGARRIGAGDLDHRIELNRHDEFGRVADEFNAMTTGMRKAQEKLIQSRKLEAMGTLAGGIAHDFNNLLATMRGCTDLLAKEMREDAPGQAALRPLRRAVERASGLTKNLVGFARRGRLRETHIHMGELIDETMELLGARTGLGIRLEKSVDADLWTAWGDPGQIHQVLLNLCLNGRDAILANGGGSLAMSASNVTVTDAQATVDLPPGRYVLTTVHDDGAGIPESMGQQVFEPFFTTKKRGGGTGLGLAVAYGIARQHGGLLCYDTGVGVGTTFSLYLPAAAETRQRETRGAAPESKRSSLSGQRDRRRILVVEDDADFRDLLQGYLEGAGFPVTAVADGSSALEEVEKSRADWGMVLLDLMLPEVAGFEVLRKIKDRYPDIPVVLMSGFSEHGLSPDVATQSYDAFLEKPFGMDALIEAINRVGSGT